MKKSKVGLTDNVTYKVFDKNGNIKPIFRENFIARIFRKIGIVVPKVSFLFGLWVKEMTISNLVTNAGAAGIASRINGADSEAAFTYIAIGIGTTAANATDTTLESEITTNGGQRATATLSRVTTDVTNDTAQLLHIFTFTGSFAITESGVLNASSAGVLAARNVFSAINVTSGDSVQITWQLDVD